MTNLFQVVSFGKEIALRIDPAIMDHSSEWIDLYIRKTFAKAGLEVQKIRFKILTAIQNAKSPF